MNLFQDYIRIFYSTSSPKYFPFTEICVHILRRYIDTGIKMMSWKPHYARDQLNRASIFYNARQRLLQNFICQYFGFVMYQNQVNHVKVGFKHDVLSIIMRSEALRWFLDTSCTDFIPVAPSCLRAHDAWYIMLKLLTHVLILSFSGVSMHDV